MAAERALQAHRRVIDALHRIDTLALREQPLRTVLREVADEVSVTTGFPIVTIEFYDQAGQRMEFAAATGVPSPPGQDRPGVPVDQSLSGLVAQRGQVLVEAHAQERPEHVAAELRQLGVQTFVCLPLIASDQVIGTLSLAHPATVSLDDDLVPLAQSLAHVVATLVVRRRAEERSQSAERHLRALLDKLAAGVVQLDADGRYLFANERAAASFGLTPPELIGKSLGDLFPPDVAQHYLERNRRFIADQAFEEREESFDLPIGRRTFFIADQVLPDPQGKGRTLLTSAVDITARTTAEAEQRVALTKYQTLFDSFPLGITVSDATGKIVESNTIAERFLGLGPEEQRQRAIDSAEWQIIRPDGTAMPAEEYASVRTLHEQRLVANVEMGVITPRGETTWLTVTAAPLPLESGGVVSTYGDITARRQAEAALRESERSLQSFLDNSPDTIYVLDLITHTSRFLNRETFLGYSRHELEHEGSILAAVHPDDQPAVVAQWHRLTTSGTRQIPSIHYRVQSRQGNWEWLYQRITVLSQTEQGAPHKLLIILSVITEQRQAEALVATQRDLARLIGTTTDPAVAWPRCLALAMRVCELDCGGLYLFDAGAQTLELVAHQGLSEGFVQASARYPLDTANAQLLLAGKAVYWSAADLQQRDVFRHETLICAVIMPIHAQGRILGCVNLGSHTLPEVPAFARHALETIAPEIGNIVVAQRTTAALHESQLRLELAVAGAGLGTWDWEVPTGRTVFNERWATMVGYTLAELAPISIQTWRGLCHPDDLQLSDQLLRAHFAGEAAFYECEARMRHKRGDWIWVIDSGKVVEWGADGAPLRMAGTHLDITARKQAELALRASEEHYRGLLESLDSVVVTVDAEGRFGYLNEVAAALFGGTTAQLSGRTMGELFPEPVAQEQLAVVQQVIREDRATVVETLSVIQGQPRWYRTAVQPIHDDTGQVIYALVHAIDVHDLKATQEELRALNQTLEARVAQRTAEVRDLYDHAPVGYHSLDRDGKLLHVNQTESDWLGYTHEELLGRPLSALMTPASQASVPAHFARLLAQGWLRDFEVELIRKDGSTFPALINATAIYDGAGAFVRTRSTLTDLTLRKQAEAALAESERRYRTLVEQLSQGVVVYQDERVVFSNAATAQIFGCGVAELLRYTLTDLLRVMHPDDAAWLIAQHITKPIEAEEAQRIFRIARPHDGEQRILQLQWTKTNYDHRPAVLIVVSDVTALKLAEEQLRLSEARLHLLLDKTPAVIFSSLAEPDFRSTFISESVRQVLGYAPAEFLSSLGFWASRIHPEDKPRVFGDAPQLLAQGWRQYEYRCRHADGSYRWVESGVSLLPAVEGRPAEVVGYMIDITPRKQAEALLQQANVELARAAQLKDEFLANMSHELRTPLNAILGRAELLHEQIYGPLTERQAQAVSSIDTSGHHLLSLINDILDLSKVEAGKVELQISAVNVDMLCQQSRQLVVERATHKRLALSTTLDPQVTTIQADERRLKQILVNLLTNAVKFTPEGGQVGLEIQGDRERQAVTLTVWDTGIGIAPEDQGRLFLPFVQLDSALNREYTGTGLGLALVLRLAELHGGSVTLESTPGRGSRFSVTLPWRHASAEERPGRTPPETVSPLASLIAERMLTQPLILLAEDHEENLQLLSEMLTTTGYRVVVARNGVEAVALAEDLRPALILMDIQMPVMDGLEAICHLRASCLRATPIIALTALAMRGDRERCLEAGADEYLTKPVGLRSLLSEIARQLRRSAEQ